MVDKGSLHNWYGALREAMMKAKEDKTMVNYYKTYKLVNIKDDFSKGTCPLGWVNFYQKFEIEKYTVFGRLILSKK